MASHYTPQLYCFEKYNVHRGTHTNIALCTSWSDPHILIGKSAELLQNFSLIGTLYSREGVSIILRNLCLNPDIDTILLWSKSPLSDTAIGSAGRNLLRGIWEQGVREDHTARATGEKIHKELSLQVIETVCKKVTLVQSESKELDELLVEAKHYHKKHLIGYMSPVSFPEPKRSEVSTFPSEEVGISVRGKTLTDAWLRATEKIMRYGSVRSTESSSNQKELQHLTWTIEEECLSSFALPEWPDSIKKAAGFDMQILKQYKDIFLNAEKPEGTSYTYGNRLNNYQGTLNQIEKIIQKIQLSSVTRRGYATTFYPPDDVNNASPPCLTQVQFIATTKNTLNLFASFRSHDIGKAAVPNAYGLLHLQEHVAQKCKLKMGTLTITSVSAHIYEEDWERITDTLKCALWERTKLYFDEKEDIDPRGIVRIAVRNDRIMLELMSLEGELLWEYSAKSAREAIMKLARLDLLSLNTHYADITIELVKAEVALKAKREYVQDRPFKVGDVVIK